MATAVIVMQLVWTTSRLISKIIHAAEVPSQNRVECDDLAGRLSVMGKLLTRLQQQCPEAAQELARLAYTLHDAYKLVVACHKSSAPTRFVLAGAHARRFSKVNRRIDSHLNVLNLCCHLDTSHRLQQILADTTAPLLPTIATTVAADDYNVSCPGSFSHYSLQLESVFCNQNPQLEAAMVPNVSSTHVAVPPPAMEFTCAQIAVLTGNFDHANPFLPASAASFGLEDTLGDLSFPSNSVPLPGQDIFGSTTSLTSGLSYANLSVFREVVPNTDAAPMFAHSAATNPFSFPQAAVTSFAPAQAPQPAAPNLPSAPSNFFMQQASETGNDSLSVVPSQNGAPCYIPPHPSHLPAPANQYNSHKSFLPQTAAAAAPHETSIPQVASQPFADPNSMSSGGNNPFQLSSSSAPHETFISALQVSNTGPVKKFEPKFTVWSDTLTRGPTNPNISGFEPHPHKDIVVDFDSINRKDKRLEKTISEAPMASTITMGKAMGSRSGISRARASVVAPPSNLPFVAPNSKPPGANSPLQSSSSALPETFISALQVSQTEPPKKFEPKSTLWSDILAHGLVDIDISGYIIMDVDSINRKDKRLDKEVSQAPVVSTIAIGKAMGPGCGIGPVGASVVARPSNPPFVAPSSGGNIPLQSSSSATPETFISALQVCHTKPLKKSEAKSTIPYTLAHGLVNLNISESRTSPHADTGVDYDSINRNDTRLERKISQAPALSTITMVKAMGSGSGIDQSDASASAPPSNPPFLP